MWRHIAIAIKLALVTILLLGLLYPLVMTGLAQVFFPRKAHGSMIVKEGRVIGSQLIGQQFTRPEYFHPRPSAAGAGYDANASSGSNLGPTSKALVDRIQGDIAKLTQKNPTLKGKLLPVDMVTTSGSGLDPDISPANAYTQVPRVAKARKMNEDTIKKLVQSHITHRQFGVLGEERINVLKLNLALDALDNTSDQ